MSAAPHCTRRGGCEDPAVCTRADLCVVGAFRPKPPVPVALPTLEEIAVALPTRVGPEAGPFAPAWWTPIVYEFDPAGEPARPFVLRDGVYFTVPSSALAPRVAWEGPNPPETPHGYTTFYVPSGHRSDGETMDAVASVLGGLFRVQRNRMVAGWWAHDALLDAIADGLALAREGADRVARVVWLSTPGFDADDAEECYRAISLETARQSGTLLGSALRVVARYAPRVAARLAPVVLRRALRRLPL